MTTTSKTAKKSVAQGAVLTVAAQWSDRLIGIVSQLILARLLVPEEFGIIAMASLVIALVDVFLDLGVNVAVLQKSNPTRAFYNTAWTLRLVQSAVTTAILIAVSPLAAQYFRDDRVIAVMAVLSLAVLLSGFENIGVVNFQKEMRFDQDFRFMFLKRVVGFLTTMVAAWVLRSYWALVIGTLAARGFGVGLSYFLHPMRPKLSFENTREVLGVSQWMLVLSIGSYFQNNLHQFIVGRRESAATLGAYNLAHDVSLLPVGSLLAPLNRVIFPALVEVKENQVELKRMFLLAQGVQALIGIPAGVGLALVANEAGRLLLDENWLVAIPFIQVLALIGVITPITSNMGYVLFTLGRFNRVALLHWIQVLLFAVAAAVSLPNLSAFRVAELRLGVTLVTLLFFVKMLRNALPDLRLVEMLGSLYRPLISAGVMTVCVIGIQQFAGFPVKAMLFIKIGTGVMSYLLLIAILWRIAGCPVGSESYLLEKARLRRWSG